MNNRRERDGHGVYYYNNGDCYEGTWANDKKVGHGTYFWQEKPGKNLEWDLYPKHPTSVCYDIKCNSSHSQ